MMIPKKDSSNGNETKDKEIIKKSLGAKGKATENATTTAGAEISAQILQQEPPQQQLQQVEKAKDLKKEVPVVSAAGPSLNDDAHHISNVSPCQTSIIP